MTNQEPWEQVLEQLYADLRTMLADHNPQSIQNLALKCKRRLQEEIEPRLQRAAPQIEKRLEAVEKRLDQIEQRQ